MFKQDNNIRLQKKRCKYRPKSSFFLKFGDYGLMLLGEGRLEFVQLNLIKKSIKVLMRNSKYTLEISKKVWYNIVSNHVIQCKSKNSRMGKGKGLFERRVIRLPKNRILFEFSGISFYKLKHFIKKINKKLNFKTTIFFNHKNYFKTATKHNLISNYYIKYLKYI